MRNAEVGGYIRISKKEAEKRHNVGEIIRLYACKVSPVNVQGVYVDCKEEKLPHTGNDGLNTTVSRNGELGTVVNAFRRYNYSYGTGYYPAYYVKTMQL